MVAKNAKTVTGSYALITIGDHEKRLDAIKRLCPLQEVIRCDAVDGDYSLVLLMHGASSDDVEGFVDEKVRSLDGVEDVDICEVELVVDHDDKGDTDDSSDGLAEETSRSDAEGGVESYAFVEVDKDLFEDVFQSIDSLESVASSEVARGTYSLVVRLRDADFDRINQLIDSKIRPLEGVLRVRQSRIIKKSEM